MPLRRDEVSGVPATVAPTIALSSSRIARRLGAAAGSTRSGIGAPMNNRRASFAISRARRAERATRALSVAIPVLAYICRYNFDSSTNARRERIDFTHDERCHTFDSE
jgi:hypothetical protein